LTIDLTKGARPGERMTFEGVTDEKPGFVPGDLHFVYVEVPHHRFKRDGDHLYLTKEISLVEALVSFMITFTKIYFIFDIYCCN